MGPNGVGFRRFWLATSVSVLGTWMAAIALSIRMYDVLGAVLGGLLVGGVGADVALALNAASFVVSAGLIASCTALSGAGSAATVAGRHLGSAVQRIAASPVLRQIAVGWTVTTLVLGA